MAGHMRFEPANPSARYQFEVRWQFRLRSAQVRPGRLFASELLAPILHRSRKEPTISRDVAFCADTGDPRGFESSRLSSQFAGMMWRPCRVYSGQDAWALAWCPARPRRRHDIMAPRSGFQSRPSLAVENSAPSAPARRPDARAARRAAWRHLSRDRDIRKRPARRSQGMGLQARRSARLLRQRSARGRERCSQQKVAASMDQFDSESALHAAIGRRGHRELPPFGAMRHLGSEWSADALAATSPMATREWRGPMKHNVFW